IPESAFFWPPLTTVRQELRQLGGMAVDQVSRMIAASHGEPSLGHSEMIWLAPKLIVRESSVHR
ncbi:MAG: hypothetical protein MUO38_04220, partial [Anaerolineales bacterium]|nr:hypothetical protein [Anaerolineales bacterium]